MGAFTKKYKSFFSDLFLELFAPEFHHGLPSTFGRPEHLESSLVARLAHQQCCFAFFPHPTTFRLLVFQIRLKKKKSPNTMENRHHLISELPQCRWPYVAPTSFLFKSLTCEGHGCLCWQGCFYQMNCVCKS